MVSNLKMKVQQGNGDRKRMSLSTEVSTNSRSSTMSSSGSEDGSNNGSSLSKRQQKMLELKKKFYLAVSGGDLEKVKALLMQGVSLKDNTESHAQSPLHVAAYEGHVELVNYFLNIRDVTIGNVDVNAQDNSGWTALHCAASPGHLNVCEILLKYHADPTIANNDKNLPLHLLARRNPERFIQNSGSSNNSSIASKFKMRASLGGNSTGNSKETLALDENSLYFRVIRMMIENGADPDARNLNEDSPMHQAALSGNEDGVKILLKLHASLQHKNKNDETPLQCAERQGHNGIVHILKEAEQKRDTKKSLMEHTRIPIENPLEIVELMRDTEMGVPVRNKKFLLIHHKKCFSGEEAIDWMLKNLSVRSRQESVQLGQKLLDQRLIQRVSTSNGKPFKDSPKALFQFVESNNNNNNSTSELGKNALQNARASVYKMSSKDRVISFDDLEILRYLGEGSSGKVFLVRLKTTFGNSINNTNSAGNNLFVMKMMEKNCFPEEIDSLMLEKRILQNDSPFLVHLHFSFQTEKFLCLVMDFIGGGDLGFYLKHQERLTEQQAQFAAAELVLALEYLHSRGVVFRDLKPENILLDNEGHICLTDFGLSKILNTDDIMKTAVGTPAYTAPEVIEGEGYTQSVDWWSFGVVLYQMLVGFTPFDIEGQDFGNCVENILNCRVLYPEEMVSHSARSLLESLLQRNPKQRLDEVDELKHHPFFTGIDWKALSLKKVASPIKVEMKSDDDVSNYDWRFTSQTVEEELNKIGIVLSPKP